MIAKYSQKAFAHSEQQSISLVWGKVCFLFVGVPEIRILSHLHFWVFHILLFVWIAFFYYSEVVKNIDCEIWNKQKNKKTNVTYQSIKYSPLQLFKVHWTCSCLLLCICLVSWNIIFVAFFYYYIFISMIQMHIIYKIISVSE